MVMLLSILVAFSDKNLKIKEQKLKIKFILN